MSRLIVHLTVSQLPGGLRTRRGYRTPDHGGWTSGFTLVQTRGFARCRSPIPSPQVHMDRELERGRTRGTAHPSGCPWIFCLCSQTRACSRTRRGRTGARPKPSRGAARHRVDVHQVRGPPTSAPDRRSGCARRTAMRNGATFTKHVAEIQPTGESQLLPYILHSDMRICDPHRLPLSVPVLAYFLFRWHFSEIRLPKPAHRVG